VTVVGASVVGGTVVVVVVEVVVVVVVGGAVVVVVVAVVVSAPSDPVQAAARSANAPTRRGTREKRRPGTERDGTEQPILCQYGSR
jgi:hypothetical protein